MRRIEQLEEYVSKVATVSVRDEGRSVFIANYEKPR